MHLFMSMSIKLSLSLSICMYREREGGGGGGGEGSGGGTHVCTVFMIRWSGKQKHDKMPIIGRMRIRVS